MEAALARAEHAVEAAHQRADELAAEVVRLRDELGAMPVNAPAFAKRLSEENAELREEVRELRRTCAALERQASRTLPTVPLGSPAWGTVVAGLERVFKALARIDGGDDSKPPASKR